MENFNFHVVNVRASIKKKLISKDTVLHNEREGLKKSNSFLVPTDYFNILK